MKLRSSLILIGTAAAGIALNSKLADDVATWVIERAPYLHSFENIHHAVGEALLVAVALALLVDPILKRDIARDAFQAAFGYALPRALRDEVRRLFGSGFLCEYSRLRVCISSDKDGSVHVTTDAQRSLRNITSGYKRLNAGVGVERWGLGQEDSAILDLNADCGGRQASVDAQRVRPQKIEQDAKICVPPNAVVKVHYTIREFKRSNDAFYFTFFNPTVDPIIEVVIPESFEHTVELVSKGPPKSKKYPMYWLHEYEGTFLAYHYIMIRWWPKPMASTVGQPAHGGSPIDRRNA